MAKGKMTCGASKGAVSPLHDLRDEEYVKKQQAQKKLMHVDIRKTKFNKDLWAEYQKEQDLNYKEFTNLRDEFNAVFADELKAHNKRQVDCGHPERQIDDYYQHIISQKPNRRGEKMHPAYEYVIQFGNHEDGLWPERTQMLKEVMNDIFADKELQKHIHILYATLHLDEPEGSPQVHLAFIPKAESNTKMRLKPTLNKALQNYLGCSSRFDAFDKFGCHIRDVLMENVLEKHGYERVFTKGEKAHSTSPQFKEIKRAEEALAAKKAANDIARKSLKTSQEKLENSQKRTDRYVKNANEQINKVIKLEKKHEISKQNYKMQMSKILKNYQKQKQVLTEKLKDLNSRSSNELTPSQQKALEDLRSSWQLKIQNLQDNWSQKTQDLQENMKLNEQGLSLKQKLVSISPQVKKFERLNSELNYIKQQKLGMM